MHSLTTTRDILRSGCLPRYGSGRTPATVTVRSHCGPASSCRQAGIPTCFKLIKVKQWPFFEIRDIILLPEVDLLIQEATFDAKYQCRVNSLDSYTGFG